MKLSTFIAQSHLPASLIRSVVRNMGGWESFKESAQDVTNHGADSGFGNFIYYRDTCAFFRKNRKAIMESAESLANDLGEDTLSLIGGFNCLKGFGLSSHEIAQAIYQSRGECCTQVQNALAWFALEEVARNFCDCLESA